MERRSSPRVRPPLARAHEQIVTSARSEVSAPNPTLGAATARDRSADPTPIVVNAGAHGAPALPSTLLRTHANDPQSGSTLPCRFSLG
jgi:hypothetical protein